MSAVKSITLIQPTIAQLCNNTDMAYAKRRVAAYARVSTDKDEQENSYNAQIDHYTDFIKNNPEWEFAGMYADEGLSGTSLKKRDDFNRMIQDALDGKIDLIIVKSVSRFARNTVDSLSTIRKLKERNIEVYFEKENIYTLDGKGELFITIMSSLAQEESRSLSENVKRGQRWSFEKGKVHLPYGRFLGYEKGEDGLPKIVEKQAEIVRTIFDMFLKGGTHNSIARYLTDARIPTPGGKEIWQASAVMRILQNEKYKGDALLQKEFTVDFLTKKRKINEGEVPQYYVKNSHPAIVPPDIFDMVQAEIQKRKASGLRQSGLSPFSSKLICGECGGFYGPKVWHSNTKYRRTVWQCNAKFTGDDVCASPHMDETALQGFFVEAFNQLFTDKEPLILEYSAVIDEILTDTTAIAGECKALTEECEVVAGLIRKCVEDNACTALDQDEYQERYNSLAARYESAKNRLDELTALTNTRAAQRATITSFLAEVQKRDGILSGFDEQLWRDTVEGMTINSNDIAVSFKNGSAISVEISAK